MSVSLKAKRYGLPLVVAAVLVWGFIGSGVLSNHWESVEDSGGQGKWRRGTVTRIDRNGDGIVDWEIDDQGMADNYIEREDTDFDGFFDRRFSRGISGEPSNVVTIHEKAPRH